MFGASSAQAQRTSPKPHLGAGLNVHWGVRAYYQLDSLWNNSSGAGVRIPSCVPNLMSGVDAGIICFHILFSSFLYVFFVVIFDDVKIIPAKPELSIVTTLFAHA